MKPRGFTLVELIVVIAIITILFGLSTQILRGARQRARTVTCANTLRQLLLGMWNYDHENGTLPYGFQITNAPTGSVNHYAGIPGPIDPPGFWWFDYSEKVNHVTGKGEEILVCPSKHQDNATLSQDILCGNYGANLSLCRVSQYTRLYQDGFGGTPLSLSNLRRPSGTLVLVDSGYGLISWWHATAEPPVQLPMPMMMFGGIQNAAYVPGMGINEDKNLLQGQFDDAKLGRHPNKTVNVGFADGAVATKGADELLVEKVGDGRWDDGPLWNPSGDTVSP